MLFSKPSTKSEMLQPNKRLLYFIQIDEEVFGKDIKEVIESKIDFVKRAAVLRTAFAGQNILVDYNWSIKVIPGSDQLRKANLHLVSLEFLVLDRQGKHQRRIVEFSEEEFTKFSHQLSALQN